MSDLFSGIRAGIGRGPDVIMNQGPLPSLNGGGPPGFNGVPDGKINQNSELLSGLEPYAYAEPGRMGSQAGYQNIPWVVQRLVPQISIPTPQSGQGSFMPLSHQVDDGDVGFVIRGIHSRHPLLVGQQRLKKHGVFNRCDPLCNIATVNYLLHGLLRYGTDPANQSWNLMAIAMGLDELINEFKNKPATFYMGRKREIAWFICKQILTPFGVARGSENQGGQHQGYPSNSAVTWPVDLATSLIVNGKVLNMVNLWRNHNISAGDDLILYLEESDNCTYNLSHHPACYAKMDFDPLGIGEKVWQLVPGVSSCTCDKMASAIEEVGHIHIARSQVHRLKYPIPSKPEARADHVTNGGLLQVTFSPVVVTAKPFYMRGPIDKAEYLKLAGNDKAAYQNIGLEIDAAVAKWAAVTPGQDLAGNKDGAMAMLKELSRERETWKFSYIQPTRVVKKYDPDMFDANVIAKFTGQDKADESLAYLSNEVSSIIEGVAANPPTIHVYNTAGFAAGVSPKILDTKYRDVEALKLSIEAVKFEGKTTPWADKITKIADLWAEGSKVFDGSADINSVDLNSHGPGSHFIDVSGAAPGASSSFAPAAESRASLAAGSALTPATEMRGGADAGGARSKFKISGSRKMDKDA